ncbi:MAG: head GIN domain-containing protein [Bacteroidota bacterium]|nr:head GIN domain-containing protein [Bacteroidota bacterium]
MKKQLTIYLLLVVLISALSGCDEQSIAGRGPVIEMEHSVDSFQAIYLQLPARLYVRKDNEHTVRIRTNENLHDLIEVTVENQKLKLETIANTNIRRAEMLHIYISAPQVSGFFLNGAGDILVEDCLGSDELTFEINGSGDVYACGLTESLVVSINGSGQFNGFDLEAQRAELRVSGSGDIEVAVTEYLNAVISGSGDILYKGNPEVEQRISGSGTIRRRP